MKTVKVTRVVQRDGDGYVSLCPELDIASQGDTVKEARENLAEAIEGFLEVASAKEIKQRLAVRRYVDTLEVSVA